MYKYVSNFKLGGKLCDIKESKKAWKMVIGQLVTLYFIPHPIGPLTLEPSDSWSPIVFNEGINWMWDQV